MQGFVTSVYDLGCFAGAIITLFIGEKLGRRWTMLVFTVIMGAGIIFQTASHTMTQMVRRFSRYQFNNNSVRIHTIAGLGKVHRRHRQRW
jgi:MFS family permease